jgi:glycosyltransferase involved in cell wall biosynthesis
MKRVDQLLAALSYGDAVSGHALAIQRHLRAAGFASEIFTEYTHPRMAGGRRPLWDYPQLATRDAVCLYHFAIGSAASRLALSSDARLALVYHNVTPGEWFLGFNHHWSGLCHHGRRELEAFVPRVELALGDSEFNRRELEQGGFSHTAVLPIAFDFCAPRRASAPVVRRLYGDGRTNLLFVGRIIPNKRIEDLILVFASYQRHVNRKSRLLLVGDWRGLEHYYDRLTELVAALRAEEVVFTGHVDDDDLQACYEVSDLFLCLSEHEGFGVPLVEAMRASLPVIAYDAAAVAETLGGAGVLLKKKQPRVVAELIGRVLNDEPLRRAILATQQRRLAEMASVPFGDLLSGCLAPLLKTAA